MSHYEHTQVSTLNFVITAVFGVLVVWAQLSARAEAPSVDSGTNLLVTAVMVLVVFIVASFARLTVVVNETTLRLHFGWGIFRKQINLAEVVTATVVKNHWYYGGGIRYWLWPKMWIYNVAGLNAVELTMKNGRVYRVGTDEPEALVTVINQIIKS